jgi:hypothetical protein
LRRRPGPKLGCGAKERRRRRRRILSSLAAVMLGQSERRVGNGTFFILKTSCIFFLK